MENMQKELRTLLAIAAGQTAILSSLIRTHPNYDRFQIDLSGLLEAFLNGAAGQTLTEQQRTQARAYVESLLGLHEAPDPLVSVLIEKIQRGL
ncbi:MAG: hypothetical protein K9K35_11690 [Rhodoferax sp.]|jgi:hypothetical protein|nr:hypothetical protein [Rhodoferax sp.]